MELTQEKIKMCPLKLIGKKNCFQQSPFCEKEDCEWYLKYAKECAIVGIADFLTDNTIHQSCSENETTYEWY